MTEQQERRPRESVFMTALVAGAPDAAPGRFVVRNLSETGCCIVDPKGIAADDRLVVTIGQIEAVEAEVAWLRDGLAGLRFLASIDLALARKRRPQTSATTPQAGWLSQQRRPHQKVFG